MSHSAGRYFVPQPSKYPIFGCIALLLMGAGAVMAFNKIHGSGWALGIGFAFLLVMLFGWFGQVIDESTHGKYGRNVDTAFRWSMGWFIFSEVMFFAAFFGVLFYVRTLALPWLSDEHLSGLIWKGYDGAWPSAGPYYTGTVFEIMHAWGIPAINTALLLTSGVTLTISHHGLLENKRTRTAIFLALTIILGIIFLFLQAYEYTHAYSELNLKLTTGIYGSTFYFLTGFHGLHVTIGTIMLTVMLVRIMRGHFSKDNHFAFEATAWYWHFVDVVWLFLFVVVYWL